MKHYRSLTKEEIDILLQQNCSCKNWDNIEVAEGFDAYCVRDTLFTGKIKLGIFDKTYVLEGNIERQSGITNAAIHNCVIGDNVYIGKINSYIANYSIGDDTYIENVDLLAVTGNCNFGNGTIVAALNEAGGREVPACDKLSAQVAYMISLYRHRPEMIANLENLIYAYANTVESDMGTIGKHVSICNCRTIKNVRIGDYAILEGCSELINGSINSNKEAPVHFGISVIAHDFIASSGCEITEGALIDRCFIGQACEIGKQYSATDTLFFSNCQGFHGEATSVFAGPFTVTHHKSSLLIAGMFSFLNAGSGSNQSNHMYKLGPIHQGIVERGSKTTSDSYILWPAKIGAFTLVMGRHTDHSDTSDLPFSYMIENNNETVLVPAANLKSVGTIRDAQKWPKRDKRKDLDKLDQINFNLLSPYTIQKMMAGEEILHALKNISGETCETYYYQNTRINNSSLHKGIYLYEMGIYKFLGNSIIKRLEETIFSSVDEIRERLKPDTTDGLGEWVDIAGLIVPKSVIEKLIKRIENNEFESIDQLNREFAEIHSNYYSLEWTWAIDKIQQKLGKIIEEITVNDIIGLVEKWKHAVVTIDEILYEDAKKEFALKVKTGFGMDGNDLDKQKDFENVRGDFDKNPFVLEVKNHIIIKTALGNELIARIKDIES
jgi:NDP-sugar pyrophosphorylase family protein